jgi:hypothetical protein
MSTSPPQSAEEGSEKHHFREDKPTHTPAERVVDATRILAADALGNSIAKPLVQHKEPTRQAQEQRVLTPLRTVDPLASTQDDEEQP